MFGQSYVILAIILVIIVAIFAVINVEPVAVNYLFWTQESPLILVILFSVLMGGIITGVVGALRYYKLQREMKFVQQENKRLVQKLETNGIPDKETESKDKNRYDKNNK